MQTSHQRLAPIAIPLGATIGFLLGSCLALGLWPEPEVRLGPGGLPERLPLLETGLEALGSARPSARAWRRVGGVGSKRSLAVARADWERGPPSGPEWFEAIPGIGPKTARHLWEACRAGAEPQVVLPLPHRLPTTARGP